MNTHDVDQRKVTTSAWTTAARCDGWSMDGLPDGRASPSGTLDRREILGASERVEQAGTAVRITRDGREIRSITRRRQQAPRLMPESIYQISTDREDAVRLLRIYGWI